MAPTLPSLIQGRHAFPQVSPAQWPWLAPPFIPGLSSSPCPFLLPSHSWPLFQGSRGNAGHRDCSDSASNQCGDAECARSASAWHKSSSTLQQRRVSWARVQRTSGTSDQITERSHAQAELSGKCSCGGWCEYKPSDELCIPLHAKYQHVYASSFSSYHFTGHNVFPIIISDLKLRHLPC